MGVSFILLRVRSIIMNTKVLLNKNVLTLAYMQYAASSKSICAVPKTQMCSYQACDHERHNFKTSCTWINIPQKMPGVSKSSHRVLKDKFTKQLRAHAEVVNQGNAS